MPILETSRLLLRPFTMADLDDFYAYAKHPQVGPNAGWKPHTSREESRSVLQLFIQEAEVLAIVEKGSGRVIGSIGLHPDGRRSKAIRAKEIGYVLSHDYWGRGYMTEAVKRLIRYAFEELDLEILSVCHFSYNQRSRRVIEKCGFSYEGTLRCSLRRYDGVVLDDCCYSMTRSEYQTRFPSPSSIRM